MDHAFYKTHSANLGFLIQDFSPYIFKAIIDEKVLTSTFCYLFSICIVNMLLLNYPLPLSFLFNVFSAFFIFM